jgi:hypothetical protein
MRQPPFDSVRQAINCGEFPRAQQLWQDCVADLTEELNTGTLTGARVKEVDELVKWSRNVVLSERAHLLDQLNRLHVAGEYEQPAPARTHQILETSF